MSRITRAFFAVLCFFVALSLVPAAGVPEETGSIVVEDSLGRTVELDGVPDRIVLSGRAVIMLIDALYLFPGVSDRVVAVGLADQGLGNFFPVLDRSPEDKVDLGRGGGPESILAQDPDVVLLKTQMRESLGIAVEATGVPVIYLDLETPEQYERDIAVIGTMLDQPRRTREIIDLYDDRVTTLNEHLSGVHRPRVLLLQFNRRDEAYSFGVAPRGWIQTTQVRLGGGDPIWAQETLSPGWNDVQFEQIAAWDPEVIVFVSYRTTAETAIEAIESDPLWMELEAVRNGSVYAMPNDFYSWGQPDTRWILGAEWIAHLLHPERFEQPFRDRIRAFFSDFYRMSEDQFERDIAPRLSGDLLE